MKAPISCDGSWAVDACVLAAWVALLTKPRQTSRATHAASTHASATRLPSHEMGGFIELDYTHHKILHQCPFGIEHCSVRGLHCFKARKGDTGPAQARPAKQSGAMTQAVAHSSHAHKHTTHTQRYTETTSHGSVSELMGCVFRCFRCTYPGACAWRLLCLGVIRSQHCRLQARSVYSPWLAQQHCPHIGGQHHPS